MDVRKQPALLALWAALASPLSVSADGFAPHSMQELGRHLGIGSGPGYHAVPCTPWGQQHYYGMTGAYPPVVNAPMLGPSCPSGHCGMMRGPITAHQALPQPWAPALPHVESAPIVEDFSPQMIEGPNLYPADERVLPNSSGAPSLPQTPNAISPSDQQLPHWMEEERRAIEPYLLKNQARPNAAPQAAPKIEMNTEEDLPPPGIDAMEDEPMPDDSLDDNALEPSTMAPTERAFDTPMPEPRSNNPSEDELLDETDARPPVGPPATPPNSTDDDDELLDSDDELLDSYYRPRPADGPAWHTARVPQPVMRPQFAPNRTSQSQPDLWRSYQRPTPAPQLPPHAPPQSPTDRWW